MTKYAKPLLGVLVLVFITIQLFLIYNLDVQQSSDSVTYLNYAERTLASGGWYPNTDDIYTNFIFAPGYINYLILLFATFGQSVYVILVFNVILNLILLLELYFLTAYFFNRREAYLAALVFMVYITNYGAVLYVRTEQLYTVLAFGSLCLYLLALNQHNKLKYALLLFAGIVIALGNWVRPLGITVIIATILAGYLLKRIKLRENAVYITGVLATILIIGAGSYINMGYFNFQSTTSGVNLIMGANKTANGGFDATVFNKGNAGHLPDPDNMTFKDRNDYWMKQSIEWIVDNPWRYAALIPKKVIVMYSNDNFFLPALAGDRVDTKKSTPRMSELFKTFEWFDLVVVWNQLIYMSLLLLSIVAVVRMAIRRHYIYLAFAVLVILHTGMTVVTVGGNVYHYPLMLIFIMLACSILAGKSSMTSQSNRELRP